MKWNVFPSRISNRIPSRILIGIIEDFRCLLLFWQEFWLENWSRRISYGIFHFLPIGIQVGEQAKNTKSLVFPALNWPYIGLERDSIISEKNLLQIWFHPIVLHYEVVIYNQFSVSTESCFFSLIQEFQQCLSWKW